MNLNLNSNSQIQTPISSGKPVLKVIGLGGGGSNAINRMIELGITGVDFIAANTDAQVLKTSLAPTKIQLGSKLTRGLGAGGNPSVGEAAAEESYRELNQALAGADMVFLTAGMGGGTGTGAIAIAARVARSLGAVTVAVVTTPFMFEVGKRQANAREGLARLRPYTDTLITIPNDRLLKVAPRDLPLEMAFRLADDVLRQGIQGISELITETGLINVDFSHIRNIMQSGGGSLLSIGIGQGERKAQKAIEHALNHPLLEAINLQHANGILVNFTAGADLTFSEVVDALNDLQERAGNNAEIIPGVITDPRMGDRVQVIMILTGLGATPVEVGTFQKHTAAPTPTTTPADSSPLSIPASSFQPETHSVEYASMRSDLDIPAFLRRRVR